jgi:hypothetical protein
MIALFSAKSNPSENPVKSHSISCDPYILAGEAGEAGEEGHPESAG